MNWFRLLLAVFLMLTMLLCASPIVYADDPPDESDMKLDVDISGDVKVNIGASGPAELNVEAKGPAQVSIDAGDQVDLDVEASDESEVFIDGEEFAQPAASQDTGDNDPGDLDNESLNLEDDVWRWNPYVVIISAAFPVLGVLTFIIIGLL